MTQATLSSTILEELVMPMIHTGRSVRLGSRGTGDLARGVVL
ncbi:hypothetical protein RCH12_001050 [Cryobacterium sp. MP_3.1]|nr:hypothetical protein [Cryobacterium sp. MP_3.1]